MKDVTKLVIIGLGGLVLLLVLVEVLDTETSSDRVPRQEMPESNPFVSESTDTDPGLTQRQAEAKEAVDRIRRELDGLTDFDASTYTESATSIMVCVGMFSAWAKMIRQARQYDLSNEDATILKDFEAEIIRIQRRSFPELRDAYGPAARRELWENDIEARTFGSGFRTIEFVGGLFAANRNIKDFQQGVRETLYKLRFKQSRYKWYEGADEYTYYEMESPDDELRVW